MRSERKRTMMQGPPTCELIDRSLFEALLKKQETDPCYQLLPEVPALVMDEEQSTESRFVQSECREKMAAWCFAIADHFDFDRQMVVSAMNYIDRMTHIHPEMNRRSYQLVSMSSLWIAIKFFESASVNGRTMTLDFYCTLSRRQFTPQDISSMERQILNELQWKIIPPTPWSYISCFVLHDDEVKNTARYLTELVALSPIPNFEPHTIGLSCILTALDLCNIHDPRNTQAVSSNIYQLHQIQKCQIKLFEIYSLCRGNEQQKTTAAAPTSDPQEKAATTTTTTTPVKKKPSPKRQRPTFVTPPKSQRRRTASSLEDSI